MIPKEFPLVQRLLRRTLNLNLQLLLPPYQLTEDLGDNGLRRMLEESGHFSSHYTLQDLLTIEPGKPMCMHSLLGYVNLLYRLSDRLEDGILLLGSFLEEPPTAEFVNRQTRQLGLPLRQRSALLAYYTALPVLPAEKAADLLGEAVGLWRADFDPGRIEHWRFTRQEGAQTCAPDKAYAFSAQSAEERHRLRTELLRQVARGDAGKARQTLHHYMEKARLPSDLPLETHRRQLAQLNVQCACAVSESGIHPFYQEELTMKLARELEDCRSLAELQRMPARIVDQYCALLQSSAASRYSGLVSKAVQYIDLHFDGPLTLRDVAAALGRSESYLAAQFKRETRLTVTGYINAKRVEEAAWLLTGSDRKIQDAAARVGISDTSYFCRLFKRQFGMTPQQFCAINR